MNDPGLSALGGRRRDALPFFHGSAPKKLQGVEIRHPGSTNEIVASRSYLTCLARNSKITPPKLMMSPSCKWPTEIGRSLTFVPLVEAKSLRV